MQMTTKFLRLFLPLFLAVVFLPSRSVGEEVRLVSLAPSLTEMAFDLGAGDALVGVTEQCRYPDAALAIPKVGSYQSPGVEAVLALKPDMTLALDEHAPIFSLFRQIGINYTVFDHRSLPGLLDSLTRLGEICGRAETARELRQCLADAFRPAAGAENGPKALLLIGRDYGSGVVSNACAVGRDDLYDRLLAAAGFRNAYEGGLAYPVLSGEGVAALAPDVIVEAVYGEMGADLPDAALMADWSSLSVLPAVRDGRIACLRGDYIFIPGMRLIRLKEDLDGIFRKFFDGTAP